MSVATMTRLAAQAEAQKTRRRNRDTTTVAPANIAGGEMTHDSDSKTAVQSAMEAIAAYIPSEGLALYIALLGLLGPTTDIGRWILFAIGVAVIVLFVYLGATGRETKPTMNQLLIVLAVALLSFAAYAGALPGSPFLQFHAQATLYAGALALILAAVLPRIAPRLGIAPA